MAIQITMHFNAPAEASDRLQIKVTLPEKKTGKAAKLLSKLFCDSYHAQRANAAPLNAEALRLLLCGDGNSETPLALDRPIRDQLATGAKLLVARGTQPPVRPPPVSPPPAPVRAKAAALAQRKTKTKTNVPAAAMARQQAVSSSAQADLAAGKALLAAGRAEEAIGRLERAAAAADNVDAHFALGLARQYTGNVAGSIRSYERAYALLGGASPPVALHSAWLNVCHNLILVHSAAGNHSSSVRCVKEARVARVFLLAIARDLTPFPFVPSIKKVCARGLHDCAQRPGEILRARCLLHQRRRRGGGRARLPESHQARTGAQACAHQPHCCARAAVHNGRRRPQSLVQRVVHSSLRRCRRRRCAGPLDESLPAAAALRARSACASVVGPRGV